MRNADINNFIYYWSARSEIHAKKTNTALFITGAEPCRCVYFKIQDKMLYKYDSTRKDFVSLNGSNTRLPLEDSYEAGEKVMQENEVENDETNVGVMMQMRNTTIDGRGFGMNTPEENTKKMEEVGLGGNDFFNFSHQHTPIKNLSVHKESSSNAMSTSSFGSKESDETNEYEMSEDDDSISSTFPSNVYKFQDAFDDDNDYMAYAS